MTRRQLLYTFLSFLVTIALLLVVIVAIIGLSKPDVKVVWENNASKATETKTKRRSKWQDREAQALKLAQAHMVANPAAAKADAAPKGKRDEPEADAPPAKIDLKTLAEQKFFEETFKLQGPKFVGWQTIYLKKAYYFVSYLYEDELVRVGPTWLVDVKRKRIIPKNAMAELAMSPDKLDTKAYFEREQQVVSAITNHTFPSGITLAGVMLLHFSGQTETVDASEDVNVQNTKILGWTIVHDYGPIYRAYFQWKTGDEVSYAEFEFDFDAKALRGANLQAANIMTIGNDFPSQERVNILPLSYNAKALRPQLRWLGPVRRACESAELRDRCRVMDELYQDRQLIAAVEWLLTTSAENAAQFETCKKTRHCCWKADRQDNGHYKVTYGYDLDKTPKPGEPAGEIDKTCSAADGEAVATWSIDPKTNTITPSNPVAVRAWRAVHPRSNISM